MRILAGTEHGLIAFDCEPRTLLDRPVTALSVHDDTTWVLTDDGELLRGTPEAMESVSRAPGEKGTCLLACDAGVFVGTHRARLLALDGAAFVPVEGFDRIESRGDWYTPWGGPPDTRSLAEAPDGTLYVSVHVGGILRSDDGGATWTQTIDIDTDIHQVIVADDGTVCATGAAALHVSGDRGRTWDERIDGLHATYLRAVAEAGDGLLVSASRSHTGRDAALYRTDTKAGAFERCTAGLPDDLTAGNIDTHWLTARADEAAFVTAEGDLYRSGDAGRTWERAADGLLRPTCVAIID